jgi:hypothetical protein
MFETLTIKELKLLIRELREHHSIKGVSKMKKPELVAELAARFILRDGNLYLKEDARPMKEPKIEPKLEKDMRLIPKDAGVKVGKNRYATTRPIPGKPSAKL